MSLYRLLGGTVFLSVAALTAQAEKPNIVVIMVDDMGYSDVGCYGSETDTPNLDALAENGIRFTDFYNSGRCCPTRASLLTGLYQHQAGVGHMTQDYGHPSYRGALNRRCVTIAEVLRPAGYFTAISGKWHVGSKPSQWPCQRGFDRFYGTPQGGGHHWKNLPGRDLVLNDQIVPMPDDWYSTTAFTNHAIRFIDEGVERDQPVFLYVAYTAPHWGLHAPADEIAKFEGRYLAGWQLVREARFARQLEMGLFRKGTRLSPLDEKVPAWNSVDQNEMDLRMATHAAMVHLVDRGVGRIVARLRELKQLDNTLILFLSDNGASAESGPTGFTGSRGGNPKARTGSRDSYNSFGISGANMCDTPFRRYKMYAHEGGIATPLIAHWPAAIPKNLNGTLTSEAGHVIDLLPTCVDVAGADYPRQGRSGPTIPLAGRSLKPALHGEGIPRPEGLFWEHQGNAAVRHGDWKLVRAHRQKWSLYNLDQDRTELTDIAASYPERVTEMKNMWQDWANRVGARPWPVRKKKP